MKNTLIGIQNCLVPPTADQVLAALELLGMVDSQGNNQASEKDRREFDAILCGAVSCDDKKVRRIELACKHALFDPLDTSIQPVVMSVKTPLPVPTMTLDDGRDAGRTDPPPTPEEAARMLRIKL